MYHLYILSNAVLGNNFTKKSRHFQTAFLEELLLALALLVCDTAAGLASRLARGLALATATVLSGLAKILGFNSLNTLHSIYPPINIDLLLHYITNFHISQ